MSKVWRFVVVATIALVAVVGYVYNQWFDRNSEAFHHQLLALDSHLDTPMLLERPGFDITQRHAVAQDFSQVDVPRMRAGGLDGGFWVIYTPQGVLSRPGYAIALANARHRLDLIDAMVEQHDDIFGAAKDAREVETVSRLRKIVVLKSIENAYPLGETPALLDYFYDRGVRMVGLVHGANNQFADSATDPKGPLWGGLSPLGRELVRRANKLGMVVDASHASEESLRQMIDLSSRPIVLSHSGAKSVYDHPRNVTDDSLRALASRGGVILVNSLASYLKPFPDNPQRWKALGALYRELRETPPVTEEALEAWLTRRREVERNHPPEQANLDDFLAHLFHVLDIVGAEHVGIGADWDGGGGVTDMPDVSQIAKITVALRRAGYTEAQIAQIWGGNLLRVLRAATD
jgi:membrane dipeptidase